MYLSASEVKIMVRDFERLLRSPEATSVRLRYFPEEIPGNASPDEAINRVYKIPNVTSSTQPIEEFYPVIHDVPDTEGLKKYPGGFVREGDSVFYFSKNVNLREPRQGFPVVFDSLLIIDSQDLAWKPRLINGGLASFHHLFRVGQNQIAQAVACFVEK